MRRFIYAFLVLTTSFTIVKAGEVSTEQLADSAYAADDYTLAAELYQQIIDSCGTSSALYYNLGNCHYRMGQSGLAIVDYERALRLDPSNEDARTNLAFVNARIVDRPGDKGTFIGNAMDSMALMAHSNTWAWIGAGCFVAMIVCIVIYLFLTNIGLRKLGFFGAIIFLIGTIWFECLAFHCASLVTDKNQAVITRNSVILSTSPRQPKDRTEEAMLLHEGTKVEIRDSVVSRTDSTSTKWFDVQVDNNHRAWIESTAIERI